MASKAPSLYLVSQTPCPPINCPAAGAAVVPLAKSHSISVLLILLIQQASPSTSTAATFFWIPNPLPLITSLFPQSPPSLLLILVISAVMATSQVLDPSAVTSFVVDNLYGFPHTVSAFTSQIPATYSEDSWQGKYQKLFLLMSSSSFKFKGLTPGVLISNRLQFSVPTISLYMSFEVFTLHIAFH